VINCATLSETLAESELFGYERGAFTGAQSRKFGRFESANGGTVFLDEVGELPAGLQPKLLRMLQEHTFERVGGTESLTADCRILAATNRNLHEEVLAGRFRQDLYFRLNVLSIQLPALRERRSDVLPLAEHFLLHFSRKHGLRIVGFTEDAALELQRYGFPGNVRELQHIVERAVLQAGGRAISAELLGIQSQPTSSKAVEEEDNKLRRLLRLPFHQAVEELEQILIHRALAAANGNKAEAARALGMHRRLLYEKLEKDKPVSQT
jgi:transcriptional regulator with GAF, ATPase, and Fis domain